MQVKDLIVAVQNVLRDDVKGDVHAAADLISVRDQTMYDAAVKELLLAHHLRIDYRRLLHRHSNGGIIRVKIVMIGSGIGDDGREQIGIPERHGSSNTAAHGEAGDRPSFSRSDRAVGAVDVRDQLVNIYGRVGQLPDVAGDMCMIHEYCDRIPTAAEGFHGSDFRGFVARPAMVMIKYGVSFAALLIIRRKIDVVADFMGVDIAVKGSVEEAVNGLGGGIDVVHDCLRIPKNNFECSIR